MTLLEHGLPLLLEGVGGVVAEKVVEVVAGSASEKVMEVTCGMTINLMKANLMRVFCLTSSTFDAIMGTGADVSHARRIFDELCSADCVPNLLKAAGSAKGHHHEVVFCGSSVTTSCGDVCRLLRESMFVALNDRIAAALHVTGISDGPGPAGGGGGASASSL